MRFELNIAVRWTVRALAAVALAIAFSCPRLAAAQNVTVSLSNAPALQEIVAGTTANTFTVSDAGVVTAASSAGTAAVRVKSGTVTPLTLTVACSRASSSSSRDCAGESITIRVQETTATGGATIGAITCNTGQTQPTGLTYTCSGAGTGAAAYRDIVLTFGTNANAIAWTSTLKLGLTLEVPANANRGATSVPAVCTRTSGSLDSFSGSGCGTAVTARILRPMAVAKSTDLAFGRIVRPQTGSGTVTVSSAGVRSVSGNATAIASSTAHRAAFTITGEGGQAISVTVPSSFQMTSGSSTLAVTTSNNLPGGTAAQTLSGAIGTNATLTVGVGGSFDVSTTTRSGNYTGSLTLTASYQ